VIVMRLFYDKVARTVVSFALHFEGDLTGLDFALVIEIHAIAEIQMDGEADIVPVDFAVLDRLLKMPIAADHLSCKVRAFRLQFEGGDPFLAFRSLHFAGPFACCIRA